MCGYDQKPPKPPTRASLAGGKLKEKSIKEEQKKIVKQSQSGNRLPPRKSLRKIFSPPTHDDTPSTMPLSGGELLT